MEAAIATIQKNRDDELRVALKEYEGNSYLDIRIYVPYQDGSLGPSKKGVTLGVSKLCQLVDALQEAERQARAQGLIRDVAA